MTTTPDTTTDHGTTLATSILLDIGSTVTARDNPRCADLVSLRFDDGNTAIQGDLATVQRVIDEAAHQLMLISAQRAEAEEAADDRERGLAGVAGLRAAAQEARSSDVLDPSLPDAEYHDRYQAKAAR